MDGSTDQEERPSDMSYSELEKKTLETIDYDTRFWDQQYLDWCGNKGPKPGKHPNPSHPFNIDPDKYRLGNDNEHFSEMNREPY